MVNHPSRKLTPKVKNLLGTFLQFNRPMSGYELELFGPGNVRGGIQVKLYQLVGMGLVQHHGETGTFTITDAGRVAATGQRCWTLNAPR